MKKLKLFTITCLLCVLHHSVAAERKTSLAIIGEAFHINGTPTYES